MNDPTEVFRRERLAEINAEPGKGGLETQYGQTGTPRSLPRTLRSSASWHPSSWSGESRMA